MTALIYATVILLIITLLLICTVCVMEIKERLDRRKKTINRNTINPVPMMRGLAREHSGPTKEEEAFYFGDDEKKEGGRIK